MEYLYIIFRIEYLYILFGMEYLYILFLDYQLILATIRVSVDTCYDLKSIYIYFKYERMYVMKSSMNTYVVNFNYKRDARWPPHLY